MRVPSPTILFLPLALLAACASPRESARQSAPNAIAEDGWQARFEVAPADWSSTGRNDYFVLEPGYRLEFENERKSETLVITVLDETKLIDSVLTRVVEEREESFGQLKEVSRNYFAIAKSTNDVYYFGEDVDMYAHGAVSSHAGSWRSGADKAKFGLLMPGRLAAGAKWYQELAPGIALDRSEVMALDKGCVTPAGVFERCLEIGETTPLEPDAHERKLYALGVGLVKDGGLRLVRYGQASKAR